MSARRLPHGSRPLALLGLLAALLPVLAGCGSSEQRRAAPAGPDPATVAPAGAALYVQGTVRPSGALKDGVIAAARKAFRVQDPGAELRRLLDRDQSDGTGFSRDFEPWLGSRASVFLLMPTGGSGDPDWAVALAIADRASYDEALARMHATRCRRTAGSYRGVRYDAIRGEHDGYAATLGDFDVEGTLRGLRAAIDASKGSSLADASRFVDAVGGIPDDALAFLYADPRPIAAWVERAPSTPPALRTAFARWGQAEPVTASLTATADRIALEASADQRLAGVLDGGSSDAQVSVGQLPGDAWLALATPPLGPLIRAALEDAGVHDAAAAQVRRAVGLDLDRDVLEPLGGLGLFARGSGVLDVGGGALLQLTDAAAAQRLLAQLQTLAGAALEAPPQPLDTAGAHGFELRIGQAPQPIVVLAEGDRVAAGYGVSSARDLLDPQQRFDDSSAGKAAVATLGDGWTPSFVLIVPPLAGLLRSLDELEVANLSPVLPYLDAYRSLAIGTKRDGDRTSVRIVAALR